MRQHAYVRPLDRTDVKTSLNKQGLMHHLLDERGIENKGLLKKKPPQMCEDIKTLCWEREFMIINWWFFHRKLSFPEYNKNDSW